MLLWAVAGEMGSPWASVASFPPRAETRAPPCRWAPEGTGEPPRDLRTGAEPCWSPLAGARTPPQAKWS